MQVNVCFLIVNCSRLLVTCAIFESRIGENGSEAKIKDYVVTFGLFALESDCRDFHSILLHLENLDRKDVRDLVYPCFIKIVADHSLRAPGTAI